MGLGSEQLMSQQVAATGPSAQRVLQTLLQEVLPYRALRCLLKEEKTGFGFGLSAGRAITGWFLQMVFAKGSSCGVMQERFQHLHYSFPFTPIFQQN